MLHKLEELFRPEVGKMNRMFRAVPPTSNAGILHDKNVPYFHIQLPKIEIKVTCVWEDFDNSVNSDNTKLTNKH